MHISPSSLFLSLASFLPTVLSAPVTSASDSLLVSRDQAYQPGIHLYSEADFKGTHVHLTSPSLKWDECYIITSQFPPGSASGLSSVSVDPKNWCTLYANTNCNPGNDSDADRLWIQSAYYDLANPEEGWGDRAQSVMCAYCPTCTYKGRQGLS